MRETLSFKTRNHSVTTVLLPSLELGAIDRLLASKMAQVPSGFFTASPFAADLGKHPALDITWLKALKKLFADRGITLIGVQGEKLNHEWLAAAGLAHLNGMATKADTPPPPPAEKPQTASPASSKEAESSPPAPPQPGANGKRTMVVKRHVRSGQRLYAEASDMVIIGTVGAGAEVIADGHIFILGSLRGRAFAGAHGDEQAFIFAAELDAELVSVAGQYQTMEQLEPYKGQKNMLVRLGPNETMQITPA